MTYEVLEKDYETLTEEQQRIVYNLIISLSKLNISKTSSQNKRVFGKFAGRATAKFSDDWEMTEEELCNL